MLYTLYDTIETTNEFKKYLATAICIQHTDITYDSVNFDDPISTLSYFKKIYKQFRLESEEEEVDRVFTSMMQLFKMRVEKGSKISAEVQAQHIMRSAAEKIHIAFRGLNQNSIGDAEQTALIATVEAMQSLLELMDDCHNEDKYLPFESQSE